MIVIPYVEKVSEAIVRIMKKHNVPVAMKPWKTLKDLLVHPKDKQDKEDITECVYKVPCANCDKTYVGETGRKLGVRLHEHKTEVESKTKRAYTRSQRTASLTEYSKWALTNHAKCAARGSLEMLDPKNRQKIAIWAPSHNFVGYIFATKARIDNRKKTC